MSTDTNWQVARIKDSRRKDKQVKAKLQNYFQSTNRIPSKLSYLKREQNTCNSL